jgi:hypothetical protein
MIEGAGGVEVPKALFYPELMLLCNKPAGICRFGFEMV